ncbi:hypothetical protein [Aquipseudomonas alcaligenes]|uniref:Uncharacterized protein n=1 Tax=Aquipseudomonas alcaligenes (strain ATCC 14909 / DSM 50342 / CCUG 1425 / JCM 20561 / NBRC 14159 / NCIMB 9945 / NCTC 10367 / 1577) TaxID=1215092 RepID=U2ZRL6_AQUA1|nr:hypothetical protein [Pseudomonas alcaligenes]GAD64080.1 hypothetical protein PA6_033_00060 [Pseudomonas alcaligenes NBRC 14159]SUD18888.1 Uncharacterised protein [Pseudomonas alcaligenes]
MSSKPAGLDVLSAVGFLGEPVVVELVWDDDPEPCWRAGYVIGLVLPVEGVHEQAFLLMKNPGDEHPLDVYLSDIRSIRSIRSEARSFLRRLPIPPMFQSQPGFKEGERRHA